MTAASGSKIVTDGLVFYYDMGNSNRSWKGRPTTNVVVNRNPTAGWGVNNYLTSSATNIFESEAGIPHLKIINVIYDSGYPRLQDNNFSINITDGFSVSYEAKSNVPGSQIDFSIYSSGSTKSSNVATLGTTWQRYTFNNLNTGFTLNQPYLRPMTTGSTYFIRRMQVEQNSFATPFVDGARSATNSLFDLTNTHNINIVGLSYISDGTFTFDGIDDYLDLGTTTQLSNNFTLSVWHRNPNTGYILDQGNIGTDPNGCLEWTTYGLGLSSNNIGVVSADGTINPTLWNNVVCSFSSGTTKFYINGKLDSTKTAAFTSFSPQSQILKIGRRAFNTASIFSGTIGSVKIYNKVLTDTEIVHNFNALRGRYGL